MAGTPPTMLGLALPDIDRWSERVSVVLGQNPSTFTGPGTNTYLVGTGERRILLDTGSGVPAYLDVLERALSETSCSIQEIVLTHDHPDHIGGVSGLLERHGPLRVSKYALPERDAGRGFPIERLDDGAVVRTEGATLRALHTPGHALDHLCFWIEEDGALFSGDNVLGVGTTVIPAAGGDLCDYLASLERMREEAPREIYPAHGPRITDGVAKLDEYIAHRERREIEILEALRAECDSVVAIVERVYAAYPEKLRRAARSSVVSHLVKLEREGRATRRGDDPLEARWVAS